MAVRAPDFAFCDLREDHVPGGRHMRQATYVISLVAQMVEVENIWI